MEKKNGSSKNNIDSKNIERNIIKFISGGGKNKGMKSDERYASFDYCFNYFQSFREKNNTEELSSSNNIQLSCLHLGFYLASWGMLRGSSFLLEKSVRHYKKLIKEISKFDKKIWNIDVDKYTDDNIRLLLKCKKIIASSLGKENNPSDILITKIMLGVFGNIPAFDSYFKKGFGFSYCEKNQLLKIGKFYKDNRIIINKYSNFLKTFDFNSGKKTKINYTKAKIVDMIGFMEGQNKP